MNKIALLPMAIGSLLAASVHAQTSPDQAAQLQAVTVTGSNIKTTDAEGASPVEVLTAAQIEHSGKTNLPDFLRTISANNGNSFNEQYTGSFSAGTASVSLRGLGSKNTLVLVDGKRVSNFATANELQDTFVDLNALPLSAVERIEVLKDGASAVYGSDAIAGVVNIILKQNYQGFEAGGNFGSSTEGTGQRERSFHLLGGSGDLAKDGYNIFFAVDGQERDRLDQDDVGWMRDNDFRDKPGGRLNWTPTNYYNNDATQGFANAVGPVRKVDYGAITPGKSGQVWAYNPAQYTTLMPKVERYHSVLRGTLKLGDDLQAYGEWIYSRTRAGFTFSPPLSIGSGLRAWNNANQTLTNIDTALPVGNPANPYGVPTPVNTNLWDVGQRNKRDRQIFNRILFGLRGRNAGWDWDISALHSESRLTETVTNFGNRYAFQSLLADGGYDFTSNTNNASAVDALRLATLRPAVSKISAANATASRLLFDLPAGTVGFAAGAEFRRESIDSNTSDAVLSGTELRPAIDIIHGARNVSAGYAEFNVPLLTTLEANIAGRLDHYSDFGNAFAPKFSLRWQPLDWLLLRGSFSRGFRAPSLPEITNSTAVSYGSVVDPYDPITPGQRRSYTGVNAANPKLKPERSKNYNVGIVVSPTVDTSIGLDYYHIVQNGIIGPDDTTYIVNHPEVYPGRVVREQGRIVTIYNQYQNQSSLTTDGVDIDFSHVLHAGRWGDFTLRGNWSRLLDYRQPRVAGQPSVNGAGTNIFGSLPYWRGSTGIGWSIGDFNSTLTWYYTGGYKQNPENRLTDAYPARVKNWSTADLSIAYTGIERTTLTLAVQNLQNRRPPWDPSYTYFDSTQADPRGRVVNVGVNYRF
ncbi:iron complex outermembrane receptor protein [Luteibacter rhizovicinus]|uniref:Iron complex outermembrane receptor protein n=1 Tax=Luteibacter rhizovicinus TaxID=242606 RepID=A0A4R3YIV6_9GAMM|nr:TonB-dependent receptor [Luteibacter rhizovicinus]TCV92337.1 iron complex outermembrane receptor protein [Luteibacter rhizovicinus]